MTLCSGSDFSNQMDRLNPSYNFKRNRRMTEIHHHPSKLQLPKMPTNHLFGLNINWFPSVWHLLSPSRSQFQPNSSVFFSENSLWLPFRMNSTPPNGTMGPLSRTLLAWSNTGKPSMIGEPMNSGSTMPYRNSPPILKWRVSDLWIFISCIVEGTPPRLFRCCSVTAGRDISARCWKSCQVS